MRLCAFIKAHTLIDVVAKIFLQANIFAPGEIKVADALPNALAPHLAKALLLFMPCEAWHYDGVAKMPITYN